MERELKRLVLREGFRIHAGTWELGAHDFSKANFPGVLKLRRVLDSARKNRWAGFQIYYPWNETAVASATGIDLVESMLAVFREVTPAMNICMQSELRTRMPKHF